MTWLNVSALTSDFAYAIALVMRGVSGTVMPPRMRVAIVDIFAWTMVIDCGTVNEKM